MKKYLTFCFLILGLAAFAQNTSLPINDFEKKLQDTPNAQLVDIRAADEYLRGHLRKSQNIDFNDENFETLVKTKLDKSRPVFLYCYSGRRSADASLFLKDLGYNQVYDMAGGFAKWTSSSKPYVSSVASTQPIAALTMENLDQIVKSNQVVFIDFFAEWCAPCKKMNPILNKIADDNKHIKLLKIDAEKNENISSEFLVEVIPTYVLIKNGKQVWRSEGEISETELKETLKRQKI